MAAPCRSRPAEQVTVCWEQRRCHSLTPTTARRRPRLHWRRGAFAVMDARPARREGLLAGARLRAVGGVAFEGAAGGLVDAGGGVDHRPPDSGPQEPVDGLQPAFLAGSSTRLPAPSSRPSTVVAVHAHRYVRQQQAILPGCCACLRFLLLPRGRLGEWSSLHTRYRHRPHRSRIPALIPFQTVHPSFKMNHPLVYRTDLLVHVFHLGGQIADPLVQAGGQIVDPLVQAGSQIVDPLVQRVLQVVEPLVQRTEDLQHHAEHTHHRHYGGPYRYPVDYRHDAPRSPAGIGWCRFNRLSADAR